MHFTLRQYMTFSGITDETEARQRIKEFIKVFGIKKIDNDTYEIPLHHFNSIKTARSYMNTGMEWKCDCGVVNNAKNGEKCLKCDFTYRDWVFRQQEEFTKNHTVRYQPVTSRETACFIFGKFTSILQAQIPRNDNLELRVQTANIAGSITFDFIKAMEKLYNELRDGEIFDVMNQLGDPKNVIMYNKIMNTLESDIRAMFNSK